jgi:DtxR family transcriptional regulator, Mn-dependent transcriptional regulator
MQLTQAMEDYVEVVAQLSRETGMARVKDIAAALGVSTASVVGALRALKDKGLVEQERYGFVRLTATGSSVAEGVIHSHEVICHFLETVLDLDPETAATDACRIEHAASPETIRRLRALAEFLEHAAHRDLDWPAEFNAFCRQRGAKGGAE